VLDSGPPRIRLSDLDQFRLDTAVERYRALLLNGG